MKWLVLAVWLVLLGIVVTRIALPLAVRLFSSFRLTASELSPWRVRGVEWRIKSHAASLVPSWRVELVSWSLGGPDAPGKLTLNVEGVTIRLHKKHQAPNSNAPDAEEAPKKVSAGNTECLLTSRRSASFLGGCRRSLTTSSTFSSTTGSQLPDSSPCA